MPPWRKNGAAAGPGAGEPGEGTPPGAAAQGPTQPGPHTQSSVQSSVPGQTRAPGAAQSASPGGGMTEAASVRQLWPQVLEAVARRSKVAWVMLQSVHVVGVEGRLLQLGFSNPGLRDNFHGSNREETLREALRELTGTEWKIDALVDPSAGTGASGPLPSAAFPPPAAPPPPMVAPAAAMAQSGQGAGPGAGPEHGAPSVSSSATPAAAAPPPFAQPVTAPEDDEPEDDDEDVDDAGPTARDLLVRELGATVLEEKSDAD